MNDEASGAETDETQWNVDRVIDYILSTHHAYLRSSMPAIARCLAKLTNEHGAHHSELARASAHFDHLSRELEQHLLKEERVLFPYVRELAMTAAGGRHFPSPFGTVENPIRMMEREHREAIEGLRTVIELMNGYTPPNDGDTPYAACMAALARFERDLHRNVDLENHVLFPKAIELETVESHS